MDDSQYLRRYLSLPALIYMLKKRKLTLLNPAIWDDGNDKFCLQHYQKIKDIKHLYAACFTYSPETYHHWKVFAGDKSGCCVVFHKDKLIKSLNKSKEVRHQCIEYTLLDELKGQSSIESGLLPFMKRYAYIDESEYRVIYESNGDELNENSIDLDISESCIYKIHLNPWINDELYKSTKELLVDNSKWKLQLKITRSTITNSKRWQKYIQNCSSH